MLGSSDARCRGSSAVDTSLAVMTVALCFAMWAASWDFMSGLTGRENFGHSLFIGAGAYTAGFLNVNFGVNPWWSLLAAPLVAVAFSLASVSRRCACAVPTSRSPCCLARP